jgi:PAS domain S-box-containing protein
VGRENRGSLKGSLAAKVTPSPGESVYDESACPTLEESQRLIQQLRVHQFELEMQNDELRRAWDERQELEKRLGNYDELYDLAPVGYFNLGRDGLIRAANLTGAGFLGVRRQSVTEMRLDAFISHATRPIFHAFLARTFAQRDKTSCEVVLNPFSHEPLTVLIEAVLSESANECRAVVIDISKIKQAEEALDARDRHFRSLIRTTMDGFWLVDVKDNYRLQEVNETYCQMSGYSSEELLARHIGELDVVESAEELTCHLERMANRGEERFETVQRRKNGERFDVEISFKYQDLDGGQLVVFIRDISERKRAEGVLLAACNLAEQSAAEMHALMEAMPAAVLVAQDAQCQQVSGNRSSLELIGLSSTINFSKSAAEPAWPQAYRVMSQGREIPQDELPLQRAAGGEAVWDCELDLMLADGGVRSVLGNAVPLFDSQGEPRGAVGAFIEITKLKRAEAYAKLGQQVLQILNKAPDLQNALQDLLASVKSVTGCAAVAIRLQDWDGFPFFASTGFDEGFLHKENSLAGPSQDGGVCREPDGSAGLDCLCGLVLSGKAGPPNDFITAWGSFWCNDLRALSHNPPSAEHCFRLRNECLNQGYASQVLVPIRRKERIVGLIQVNERGKGRLTRATVELLEGIAGHIGAALLRRQAEMERIKLEERLQHAQQLESVGRLAGGVAHDFNNMLSVIIGHANLALAQPDPTQQFHGNMEQILKAAERSADLTRQLLAFARKQTIAPKVLNLNEVGSGMLSLLQRLIGEQITLAWRPGQDLWPVKMDPSQMDQILANLCVNARDAITGVGTITIETANILVEENEVASQQDFRPGEYVQLSVSDSGCGIEAEILPHIFEPFFTTKGTGAGTGLGLATVYGVVSQNGGFLKVQSNQGQGTTFTLHLPRQFNPEAPGEVSAAQSFQKVEHGHETILLVEDEPGILDVTTMILTQHGYRVLPANTPAAAIKLSEEHAGEISLLLTDVVMPEMNGRDLARHLGSLNPHLKRLFMSGYTADIISHNGVLDDGIHFIQKPFGMKALTAKVRAVLDDD